METYFFNKINIYYYMYNRTEKYIPLFTKLFIF